MAELESGEIYSISQCDTDLFSVGCPFMCQLNLHIAMDTLSELSVAPMLYLANFLSPQQSRADSKHQAGIKVMVMGCCSIYKGVNYWVSPRGKDTPELEVSLRDQYFCI